MLTLDEDFDFSYWKMESPEEEKDYLNVEAEDVFVQEPWRKRGFAKFLLAQALEYLKAHELNSAYLKVETTNLSALSLYKSVGFEVEKEEIRYYTELK